MLQRRRERINERLRILQNLVPNGTKVDISTMLEEAVHYVKFLQLQIKVRACVKFLQPPKKKKSYRRIFANLSSFYLLQLLSSDDLWMFAPIAYNGIDIGLNQKMVSMLL